MPRAIKNAANNVSNSAEWASLVLSKVNDIIDAIRDNQSVEMDVEIPLGDNIAHLFRLDHLEIDGKPIVLRAKVTVKLPETPENSEVST